MSEHDEPDASPWASASSEVHVPASPEAGTTTLEGNAGRTGSGSRAGSDATAGPLGQLGGRAPSTMAVFGWGAGLVLAIGLTVVLVMSLSGASTGRGADGGLGWGGDEVAPDSDAPPLAQLCPPPSEQKEPEYAEPPAAPPGARTVDSDAGISYAAYGDPWQPWAEDWSGGDLQVHYRTGQHFVTETYAGGEYHASILSGSVPATVNDGMALDLKCTGKQVSADVRLSYYPEPNKVKVSRDERTTLGGRPAWVSVFRLRFTQPGLQAKSELVGVALIDVGRREAAVLYVSIPGTHSQHDHIVDDVIASVRMIP